MCRRVAWGATGVWAWSWYRETVKKMNLHFRSLDDAQISFIPRAFVFAGAGTRCGRIVEHAFERLNQLEVRQGRRKT